MSIFRCPINGRPNIPIPASGSNPDSHPGVNIDVEQRAMGILVSRRKGAVRACITRNSSYIVLIFLTALFFHAGLNSSHSTHPDLLPGVDRFSQPGRVFRASKSLTKSVVAEHPIPKLMDNAEQRFREKLKRQSTSLEAAVREYKRRYKRNPPKGFDDWWAFVKRHDVKMVDEYDGLMKDLEPFMDLSGEEIRRRTLQAGQLPSIHLVRIRNGASSTVKMNHAFEDSEVSARAHGFQAMMGEFEKKLPDMDFAINAKAEGRVLVSWEHRTYPNTTQQDSSDGIESMLGAPFKPDWGNDGNIWEAWRRTCPPKSPARRLFSSLRNPFIAQGRNYFVTSSFLTDSETNSSPKAPLTSLPHSPGNDFSFAAQTNAHTSDFCKQPHLHTTQGHFFSDWRSLPALYPVFTPAKAQGFLDIRIPSHYYYGSTERYTYGWDPINLELHPVDSMEVPWEQKKDMVFWRGATTGGGSHPPGFAPQYQRHRFVRMTSENTTRPGTSSPTVSGNGKARMVTFEDPPGSGGWVTASVPVGDLNEEMMDVAFVKAVASQSYPGGLKALTQDHRFGDTVPLGTHWQYKYLVDLDGMSYSGRFMAFLASDSVPIKATVYEEYYSDWIEPWVHFIPLSSSYKELYNIVTYFSGPTPSMLHAANSSQPHTLSTFASTMLDNRQLLESNEGRAKMRSPDVDRRLKRIARAGKHWKATMGRKVDMEAYVYRLCLEWARLWADDRTSMDYQP